MEMGTPLTQMCLLPVITFFLTLNVKMSLIHVRVLGIHLHLWLRSCAQNSCVLLVWNINLLCEINRAVMFSRHCSIRTRKRFVNDLEKHKLMVRGSSVFDTLSRVIHHLSVELKVRRWGNALIWNGLTRRTQRNPQHGWTKSLTF